MVSIPDPAWRQTEPNDDDPDDDPDGDGLVMCQACGKYEAVHVTPKSRVVCPICWHVLRVDLEAVPA